MLNNLGIMQGRLLPMIGNKIQAFPEKNWKKDVLASHIFLEKERKKDVLGPP